MIQGNEPYLSRLLQDKHLTKRVTKLKSEKLSKKYLESFRDWTLLVPYGKREYLVSMHLNREN